MQNKVYWGLLFLLHLRLASGQSAAPVPSSSHSHAPAYLRIYPLELLLHEARVGIEFGVKQEQSLVLDASYFWGFRNPGLDPSSYPAVALKADYRFYWYSYTYGTHFFVGPNLLYKRGVYRKRGSSTATDPLGQYNGETDYRTVSSVNVKVGMDRPWVYRGRSRYELFTGGGIRYQTVGPDLRFGSIPYYVTNRWVINLLLGILVKF
ncbi:hypothetical protein [Spirosoma panaciterrae]|uniref:hypothetical protein n=1 Tax=Spirosoma panaciterrae TaxID=496058 RepID=UPI000374190B|nr:hypothetical protein [Spirosoma panaciterrae]